MIRRYGLSLVLPLVAFAAGAKEPPPAGVAMSADECAAWNRERSFAQSVERHDAAAFAEHLHPGAVFIGGDGSYARGREGVVRVWAAIIDGDVLLRWHPRAVVIGGDPNVALSRGPYWMKNTAPDAEQPYLIGQFISTWVKGADGRWYVLFDGGGGNQPRPATAAEVAALKASLPKNCPGA